MPIELTAEQAAARLHPDDTLGIPLGPGQPPALLRALGDRDDWTDLRVYGALLAVGTDLFTRPGVRYYSGFFGPLERALITQGARIEFVPSDFRRFGPLLQQQNPRVMTTVATEPDADGWCSLSLHAGGTVDEIHRAGADPDRILIVEAAQRFPRTFGHGEYRHAVHVDEIDILVRSTEAPLALPGVDTPPSDVDRAIAAHAVKYIPSGATLQTGIGSIPSQIATLLAEGDKGDFGLHSEMFTDGCMRLHRAGKVTNTHKGQYHGLSVTTFAFGSPDLYSWLDGNPEVAFLPVGIVNAPEVIAANHTMISINGALAVDAHGQVVADTIDGRQFSGIGGAEDFVAGAGLELSDRSLICLPSTVEQNGVLRSRIVARLDAGAVVTTPRHQVDIVITEYGAAELEGKTVRERAEALAAIAHPQFRDEILATVR
ncbi:acetyl-CoA hydrolase/transferase C-terminal domain protein [Mycolicibacterium hassiacum DSM 44199]|uniref:Acetyl-CoA hydrolase/transferase C-terminal domain protein n=1 Tax=Mycolicibacterium hassiacum (strain DSM 44199 / CIP 105218 / JCM 12690 / 3849) TaxID=1122247 RepID=K5BDB2_MYCHD|nr:acetyl-CoA hydrolase/transferase C-terminal domain-containing protein [Mycolicibacterium hassiacum]EKF25745.1 acetyl-CoA hydrolase/transferase C-terminal domain protein [Mycolicibacterium hassiacum DSM 44199]MDA4086787.1 4-hydroxybutyrate CoA-transferase [Mycolicibacterium hassiacum DSM 44199]VCT92245.1 Succinyl-CoA:coenzyme A transferase [Mycolicibacterium hassiacum DSM 44199]